jgi:hypothetical protein
MGRKKNAPQDKASPHEGAAPEEASPVAEDFAKDEPLHQPPQEPAEKPRTIDMVRAAIAAGRTTAKVALPWIKEQFGVDMKAGNFSVTKSTIERGNKKAAASEPAPKRKYTSRAPKMSAPVVHAAAPASTPARNGAMSPSEAARSVKELVDKLGVAEVRNLVELFGG